MCIPVGFLNETASVASGRRQIEGARQSPWADRITDVFFQLLKFQVYFVFVYQKKRVNYFTVRI